MARYYLGGSMHYEDIRLKLSRTKSDIDDGSHRVDDQTFFLMEYPTLLVEGGFCVCEDVLDRHFFKEICRQGCFGIDGWANTCSFEDIHEERLLLFLKKNESETEELIRNYQKRGV